MYVYLSKNNIIHKQKQFVWLFLQCHKNTYMLIMKLLGTLNTRLTADLVKKKKTKRNIGKLITNSKYYLPTSYRWWVLWILESFKMYNCKIKPSSYEISQIHWCENPNPGKLNTIIFTIDSKSIILLFWLFKKCTRSHYHITIINSCDLTWKHEKVIIYNRWIMN